MIFIRLIRRRKTEARTQPAKGKVRTANIIQSVGREGRAVQIFAGGSCQHAQVNTTAEGRSCSSSPVSLSNVIK